MQVPETTPGFQFAVHGHRTGLAGPSHGEFHGHNRNAHDRQKDQIYKNKGASAVLTHQPGEFPYVADTDGASGRQQNKAQTASQLFTLFQNRFLLCYFRKNVRPAFRGTNVSILTFLPVLFKQSPSIRHLGGRRPSLTIRHLSIRHL